MFVGFHMNESELQALAILLDGRVFEGKLYLTEQVEPLRAGTCKLCVFEHQGGPFCSRFYSALPKLNPWPCANGSERIVWRLYEP